jgi:hypothetical protein
MSRPTGRQGALRSALPAGAMAVAVLAGAFGLVSESRSFRAGPAEVVVRGGGASYGGDHAVAANAMFTIAGSLGGLYPGDFAPLRLNVHNPYAFAIVVTSISTAVGPAGPGCGAGNLAVASFSGPLKVPGGGAAHTTVTVMLRHKAPDACQGAVFPLTYSGMARKA